VQNRPAKPPVAQQHGDVIVSGKEHLVPHGIEEYGQGIA
jgi:hypothetical protein